MNEISSVMLKVFHGHSRQTRVLSLSLCQFLLDDHLVGVSIYATGLYRYLIQLKFSDLITLPFRSRCLII